MEIEGDSEFDVEADDTGTTVRAAPPAPPEPTEPARRPPGRPKGSKSVPRASAEELRAQREDYRPASTAPSMDISKKGDEWPREGPDLWLKILEWTAESGHDPHELVIYVERVASAGVSPMRFTDPIPGDAVMGDENRDAGQALIEYTIDGYHMEVVQDHQRASYVWDFRFRSMSAKIKRSIPYLFDSPEGIRRLRMKKVRREQEKAFLAGTAPPPGMTMPQMSAQMMGGYPQPRIAVAPASPPAPVTGDPYADKYIQFQQSQLDEARAREDEERRKREEADRLRSESDRRFEELRAEILALKNPPPPPPVVEPEEVKQAKMAALVAQAVVQGLQAMGFKPPPVADPAAAPAAPAMPPAEGKVAVHDAGDFITNLDRIIDEAARLDKVKGKMRNFLGVKEEEEEEEEEVVNPTRIDVLPSQTEMRVRKIPGVGGLPDTVFPIYDEDDEVGAVTKIVNWFGANPTITQELAGKVVSEAVSRLQGGPLMELLGKLMAQGGIGAATVAAATANGAGKTAGFVPPTA